MNKASIGLIGNPNCGKTTLFNALTGARQQVGNWPGVTVERKTGYLRHEDWRFDIIDLPGTYNLNVPQETLALDERIACQTLHSGELDVVINIIDATNLERNLFLTTQLLEIGVPVVIALNMMDDVEKRGVKIDLALLEARLGCQVVAISASQRRGLAELKRALISVCRKPEPVVSTLQYPLPIERAIVEVGALLQAAGQPASRSQALRALENDGHVNELLTPKAQVAVREFQQGIESELDEEVDILLADARYAFIQNLVAAAVRKTSVQMVSLSQRLDQVVLNRFLGIPIFLAAMYLMFVFAINIGGAFQDFFDIGSDAIFVQGLGQGLQHLGAPAWLIALLAAGLGKGINTTITFAPIIGGLFLFLSFLEGSGYMARAAFVVDRFMRAVGLPGKSFVPMIVGFGCNVPAIMAARTLENRRDRIITILMSPFMSCGARLAIFAVFTAAFFPQGGQNVVFALYLIGILVAIATGLILRKTLLKGDPSPLVMELPPYRVPTLRALLMQTWRRLKGFLFRAGKLIVPICLIIGTLNTINIDGSLNDGSGSENSVLSLAGKTMTPVFQPMGLQQDNWPATVGLLTGVLAKEVVVGTLNTLYTQVGHLQAQSAEQFNLKQGLLSAWQSIPENLANLKNSFSNPVLASAPLQQMNQGVLGQMYQRFGGQVSAFAYLLFVLLYFPCVSATAATLRELNRGWAAFSVLWNTGLAYGAAVLFYQTATFSQHPRTSLIWIFAIVFVFSGILLTLRQMAFGRTPPSSTPDIALQGE